MTADSAIHTRTRRLGRRVAATIVSIVLVASGAAPAIAAPHVRHAWSPGTAASTASATPSITPHRLRPPSRIVYRYIQVKRTYNWTNKARQLGICKVHAGAGGGRCTISSSYEVEASVGLSFGLTKAIVSAGLNVNGHKKVSGTVSWTSPRARAGSAFTAWAVGTRVTYRIQKWKITKSGGRTLSSLVDTSPTLRAFIPVQGFAVGQ